MHVCMCSQEHIRKQTFSRLFFFILVSGFSDMYSNNLYTWAERIIQMQAVVGAGGGGVARGLSAV
jgi:hypothetical protein